MDYDHNCCDGEHWDWQGKDFKNDSDCDASRHLWNEVALNEEDHSYMLDETTPVKACGDLAYHVTHNDSTLKETEEYRETSSQLKRRRMLQFDAQKADFSICNELPSAFLQSNESGESLDDVLPQASEWIPGFSDASVSGYDVLDQSCEKWLADCFDDPEMKFSPNIMTFPGECDVQIDVSEFCNPPLWSEANVAQKRVIQTTKNVVFKGSFGKNFIRRPSKLASSVVYPFAFIKPCEFHGDVTLKDINKKICTPPSSSIKQNDEDPASYPTSAFSGKPVVGKTKIHTGGKGSITIMRTKG